MRVGTSFAGSIPLTLLLIAASLAGAPHSVAKPKSAAAPPPAAEVLTTLDLSAELQWYYRNDVGVLLIYAGNRLYRLDLLADDPHPQKPLLVPGLTEERSVLPVGRTGLLLIPDAALEGKPPGSYAIDTLSGEIAWQAPALPAIDRLFSFPDSGMAVARCTEDGGRLIAIDLRTGERVWEIAKWARAIWTEAPYLRAVMEDSLLTLDVQSGETVRKDAWELPESKRWYVFSKAGVALLWNNRKFSGFSLPPIPPAATAPPRKLWDFRAGGMMIGQCIKIGNCRIRQFGDDLLLVRSAGANELIRLPTGKRIADFKKGFFGSPVSVSPTGKYIAHAAAAKMRILDGATGDVIHEIQYPEGGEGMKSLRYLNWPRDDLVMVVFPDKKGNPRKMTGFSCSDGSVAWTTVLPEVADYLLTSEQRAKLVGRITQALVMTAVSAANPVTAGGYNYAAVFVPNLNVSESLAAGLPPARSSEAGEELLFASALERHAECERRIAASSGKTRLFVVGPKRRYDVLTIDLDDGGVQPLARYEAETVHAIAPFAAFGRAVTLENNNTRVRLLGLE